MDINNIEEEQVKFLRCIGEATRLQILKYIINEEKCVTDIVNAIGKEQSLISHHLKHLKECNIVTKRRKAKKAYYSLSHPKLTEIIIQSANIVNELPLCKEKE
ncbi:MAG: helix-turn-helix transcriptional regulator [Dehalococcoidia bacterium]|nr:MAG: helix-turn-helix transcriptional regulator [Dehalococcoidia bacterium]